MMQPALGEGTMSHESRVMIAPEGTSAGVNAFWNDQ